MFLQRHHSVFSGLYHRKKILPNDIKNSSQWFTEDIAMFFQRHRNDSVKTSQCFFSVIYYFLTQPAVQSSAVGTAPL
jgi:hypothetical protein